MTTATLTEQERIDRNRVATRENRSRRAARRLGLRVEKFFTTAPVHQYKGTWQVRRESDGLKVATGPDGAYGLTLDEVETFLAGYDPKQ